MEGVLALFIAGQVVVSQEPGKTLKQWRLFLNVSQKELAKKMDVSPSVISDYEKGRRKHPGTEMLQQIVAALVELNRKQDDSVVGVLATQQINKILLFEKPKQLASFSSLKLKKVSGEDLFVTGLVIATSFPLSPLEGKAVVFPSTFPDTKILSMFCQTTLPSIILLSSQEAHEKVKLFASSFNIPLFLYENSFDEFISLQ